MKTKEYKFYSDSERSWLEVPIDEVKRLGIENKLSKRSSFDIRERLTYLDQNYDAGVFVEAKKLFGEEVSATAIFLFNYPCFIKRLPKFATVMFRFHFHHKV